MTELQPGKTRSLPKRLDWICQIESAKRPMGPADPLPNRTSSPYQYCLPAKPVCLPPFRLARKSSLSPVPDLKQIPSRQILSFLREPRNTCCRQSKPDFGTVDCCTRRERCIESDKRRATRRKRREDIRPFPLPERSTRLPFAIRSPEANSFSRTEK